MNPPPQSSTHQVTSRFSESCWEWSWAMQCPLPVTSPTLLVLRSEPPFPVTNESLSGIQALCCPRSFPTGHWPSLSAVGPSSESRDFSRLLMLTAPSGPTPVRADALREIILSTTETPQRQDWWKPGIWVHGPIWHGSHICFGGIWTRRPWDASPGFDLERHVRGLRKLLLRLSQKTRAASLWFSLYLLLRACDL